MGYIDMEISFSKPVSDEQDGSVEESKAQVDLPERIWYTAPHYACIRSGCTSRHDGEYVRASSSSTSRVWDEAIEIVKQNIIYADDIKIGHAAAVIAHTVESRLKSRIVGALENAKARSLAQQEGK